MSGIGAGITQVLMLIICSAIIYWFAALFAELYTATAESAARKAAARGVRTKGPASSRLSARMAVDESKIDAAVNPMFLRTGGDRSGIGDSQDAPFGGERVIASAAVLNVLEHLFAGDAFGASGVGAGAGEHFAQFGATEGLDDHLAAAAGLDGSRMRELADQLHDAEADHHGLGGLEGLVDLPILFVKLGFEVGFELWKGKNGHGR